MNHKHRVKESTNSLLGARIDTKKQNDKSTALSILPVHHSSIIPPTMDLEDEEYEDAIGLYTIISTLRCVKLCA